MKILLLGINARYTHSNLALRYLRNEILAAGHEAVLKEYSINSDRMDILDLISKEKPDVILVSVYIWNKSLSNSLYPT